MSSFPGGRLSQALLAGSSCIWMVPCSGWTRFWPRWVPRLHAAPVCPKQLRKCPPKKPQPITWSLNSKLVSPFMKKKNGDPTEWVFCNILHSICGPVPQPSFNFTHTHIDLYSVFVYRNCTFNQRQCDLSDVSDADLLALLPWRWHGSHGLSVCLRPSVPWGLPGFFPPMAVSWLQSHQGAKGPYQCLSSPRLTRHTDGHFQFRALLVMWLTDFCDFY